MCGPFNEKRIVCMKFQASKPMRTVKLLFKNEKVVYFEKLRNDSINLTFDNL